MRQHLHDVQQQAMYCVIHGGIDKELRKSSVEYLTSLPFDGYGIGGSLGNGHVELFELLRWMMPMFDATEHRKSKPRHLLGIADETSIDQCIALGIDTVRIIVKLLSIMNVAKIRYSLTYKDTFCKIFLIFIYL